MIQAKFSALVATLATLTAVSAMAQPAARPRVSPHETTSAVISGNRVTLVYGRPYSKDPRSSEIRKVWGTLVPYGKAWRLGADEATLLITQKPLSIGEATIPAGAYTIYLVPEENGGKLAFSTALGGWGIPVDEQHDLVRVDLKKEPLETPNEQLALSVGSTPGGGGVLKIMWEGAQYSLAFANKN